MHTLSTAVPQSSSVRCAPTALCFLGLLGVLHEYACGARPAAGALAGLVIVAPAALRHENLCIVPARAHGRAPYKLLMKKGLWAHSRAPLQALIKLKWDFETVSAVRPYRHLIKIKLGFETVS